MSDTMQRGTIHSSKVPTMVAEAAGSCFVDIICTVSLASAELSVGDGTLQGAAVDGGHGNCVGAMLVLQGVGGHGCQSISTQ